MTALPPDTAIEPGRDTLIDEVTEWLMEQALEGSTLEKLLTGTFDGMIAAGLPIVRAYVGMTTLHPLVETISYTWRSHAGLTEERFNHGQGESSEAWLRPACRKRSIWSAFLCSRSSPPTA